MRCARNTFFGLLLSAVIATNAQAAVELGIDVLEANNYAPLDLVARSARGNREMFFKCYDSASIEAEIAHGSKPGAIVAGWTRDVVGYRGQRSRYLLY